MERGRGEGTTGFGHDLAMGAKGSEREPGQQRQGKGVSVESNRRERETLSSASLLFERDIVQQQHSTQIARMGIAAP